jgi:hypothetical protein
MALLALFTWLITALGGFLMLGIWISRGGARGSGRLPVPVMFGHFALAAAGMVVWVLYLLSGLTALAWTALALLVPVAALGFVMFARWIPQYRARAAGAAPAGGAASEQASDPAGGATAGAEAVPAERAFPVPVVIGHGILAVATVVLALLSALQIGD